MAILRNIIVLVCFAHFFVQGGAQGNFDLNDNYKWSGYSEKPFKFRNFEDTEDAGYRYRITQNGPEYGIPIDTPGSKKPFEGAFTSNVPTTSLPSSSPMQKFERHFKIEEGVKDSGYMEFEKKNTVGVRNLKAQNVPEFRKPVDTPVSKEQTRSNVKTSLHSSQMQRLERQLHTDEGEKHSIYLDTKKNPTFGIGHKITRNDPEYGKPVGTTVSEERVYAVFKTDVAEAVKQTQRLYGSKGLTWPSEVQDILANMAFNNGIGNLEGFKKMKTALDDRNWQKAADEMEKSKWHKDDPNRVGRLVKRMRNVKEK
ncbi:LYST1-like protein [Mya arenaria]|uniref:LYST1-like protein n=1 Tax=Mya arenaria TaxID=6604 RepID=A0ABY7DV88_MYAAR|nr:uncharacterized protein LOC128230287 [Mya arenaria]WAR01597.1 LYST1-like protein [Mya arenaria]